MSLPRCFFDFSINGVPSKLIVVGTQCTVIISYITSFLVCCNSFATAHC